MELTFRILDIYVTIFEMYVKGKTFSITILSFDGYSLFDIYYSGAKKKIMTLCITILFKEFLLVDNYKKEFEKAIQNTKKQFSKRNNK